MGHSVQRTQQWAATPERVREMLLDPAFREQVCAAQHVASHRVQVEQDGAASRVTIEQEQVVRDVPSVVTRIVGETLTIRQEEQWTGNTAQVAITLPAHSSGRITGTTRLVPDGDGTRVEVDWDIVVSIPLVGKKVASIVADVLGHALDVEDAQAQAWLSA